MDLLAPATIFSTHEKDNPTKREIFIQEELYIICLHLMEPNQLTKEPVGYKTIDNIFLLSLILFWQFFWHSF